jgi:hypothetical protein
MTKTVLIAREAAPIASALPARATEYRSLWAVSNMIATQRRELGLARQAISLDCLQHRYDDSSGGISNDESKVPDRDDRTMQEPVPNAAKPRAGEE